MSPGVGWGGVGVGGVYADVGSGYTPNSLLCLEMRKHLNNISYI